MALLQDVRTKARHRGLTPWQLVQKIRRLEQEADETTCKVIELTTEVDELKAERTRLEGDFDKAAIDLSGAREDLALAREEIRQLEAAVELRDQTIEDLARKIDVGVKAEHVIAQTQELDSEQIRRHCAKPIPLHQSPLAVVDPGRVPPSWARSEDDTASVPVVEPDPATTH